jgi:uncharacterized protein YdhG (YjbR/CyaY superfamily)
MPQERSKGSTAARTTRSRSSGLSAEERAAMKARARELKAEEKAAKDRAVGEAALLEAIAGMEGKDKAMAERVHAIVTEVAPELRPKTWYGMPAYAKDGKVICFFQAAGKFKARYATFGFSDEATIDTGSMFPTAYALKDLTPTEEKKIAALVKKAVR